MYTVSVYLYLLVSCDNFIVTFLLFFPFALFPASEQCVGWIQKEIVLMVQTHLSLLLGRSFFFYTTSASITSSSSCYMTMLCTNYN